MKRTVFLLGFAVLSLACDDADKKKAELIAKTGGDASAATVDASGVNVVPAPATAETKAAKPPKECPTGNEVAIEDPDLEAELRVKLDKPKDKNPGNLTTADLAKVRSVNLAKKSNLDELDPCVFPKMTNLKHLYLGPGKYRDLKPIAGLTQLESLRASISEVEDLKPLEKLVMLDRLDLGRTHVRDLGPIANLVNLTELSLDDVPATDLTPLSKLKKLEKLSIQNTAVTDVSPLKDLTKLKILDVKGTAISNLDTIQPLTAKGLKIVTK